MTGCSAIVEQPFGMMIYPNNFEHKIGFDKIRELLAAECISEMGREEVAAMRFSDEYGVVTKALYEVRELRQLQEETEKVPLLYAADLRDELKRLRLEGTYIDEEPLFNLCCVLQTMTEVSRALDTEGYPTLSMMKCRYLEDEDSAFPLIIKSIDRILDKFGKVKDSASQELQSIRHDIRKAEANAQRTLYNILKQAQQSGLVDKDAAPTMRDGRLVIPVAPAMKRKLNGIVLDESATGKTVFMEPAEVVESNNRIRELENEERKEVIRILKGVSSEIRPSIEAILRAYTLLGHVDFLMAKAQFAEKTRSIEPIVSRNAMIDWVDARHPLLEHKLAQQGKPIVSQEITLTKEKRLLVVSGPNAGGKSICLKTVGLLQYMLQCGMPIPVSERSKAGLFSDLMIDIGDEQSIEDELSTYSGHLLNMKNMMRRTNQKSLILIDEFGGGTEPQIGGAIAEAVLNQYWKKQTFGVITTHYQNLKHFADDHEGVVNGAMLYDRHEMRPLFKLAIGRPGSSFAIEIARKTGIPEEVIAEASDIVGRDYIQSDKYLQDIVRDKRYWEGKRQEIHSHEKKLESRISHFESQIDEVEQERKAILRRAKEQAEELLRETNKRIENTIREIREAQAAKEETKRIREELEMFKDELDDIDTKASDELIERKIQQIQRRKEKREKKRQNAANAQQNPATNLSESRNPGSSESRNPEASVARKADNIPLAPGMFVRIRGTKSVGVVDKISGGNATVIFGGIRSRIKTDRLEPAEKPKNVESKHADLAAITVSRTTRQAIDEHKLNFKQDIDIRGFRVDEAINAVQSFIDDAILLGATRVRILHGTGTGALRHTIRQYLSTIPNVTDYRDEHVQFGGAGITVVEL